MFSVLNNATFRILILPCALALLLSACGQHSESGADRRLDPEIARHLPDAPQGFSWRSFQETAFLLPEGWFEQTMRSQENGYPVDTYGASPEDFSETQLFETGFTIQIMQEPQQNRQIEAKKVAMLYISFWMDERQKENILMFDKDIQENAAIYTLRYRDAPTGLPVVIVHKRILADNAQDRVHIFSFESPEESWEENWKRYGDPMMRNVRRVQGLPASPASAEESAAEGESPQQ